MSDEGNTGWWKLQLIFKGCYEFSTRMWRCAKTNTSYMWGCYHMITNHTMYYVLLGARLLSHDILSIRPFGISHNTQISSQFRLVSMILPFSLANTKRNLTKSRFYSTSQFPLQISKWGWILLLKMSASSLQVFRQCNYGYTWQNRRRGFAHLLLKNVHIWSCSVNWCCYQLLSHSVTFNWCWTSYFATSMYCGHRS